MGDDGNMAEPGGHLARKALRRRKPQAAGVNARPTLWLGMGGDTEEAANRKVRRRADVSIGPYAGGLLDRHPPTMPAVPGCAGRTPCVVGRAFTPAGEVCGGMTLWLCVNAAPQGRGGLRQPGRVLARSCAAPLSRLTPTAPLTGEPFRRQFPQSLPCKGRWVRRKAQTEGRLAARKACATAASLSAGPFRPAGAGRSLIGRPGELLWDEKRGMTRHGPYGVENAAILGRPHLALGDSQGDRGPLEPCPAPRN